MRRLFLGLLIVIVTLGLSPLTSTTVGAAISDNQSVTFADRYSSGDEVIELRDQYSETFMTDEGYSTRISLGSVHYEDDNGNFQPIDTTIVPSDKTGWDWEVTTGHWELFIRNDATVAVKKGDSWVGTRFHGIAYLDISTKDYTILQTANIVTPVVSGNTIRWEGILYGVDFVVRYTNDSFKEDIVVRQELRELLSWPGYRPSDYGYNAASTYLVPIFEVDWSQSLPMKLIAGTSVNPDEAELEQTIYFESPTKDRYFDTNLASFLPLGYAVSELPVNPGDLEKDWKYASERIRKRLVKKNDKHWLLMGVPVTKLNQMPAGSIIFDPTETLRPSGEGSHIDLAKPYSGDHYVEVDESGGGDGDSTYVGATSDGSSPPNSGYDLYNLPDSSSEGIINKVTVFFRVRATMGWTEASSAYAKLRTHSSTRSGTSKNTEHSQYILYSHEWANNPSTATTWTWDEIDALEIGVYLYIRVDSANGQEDTRCTQVYVEVDYTPLAPPTVTTQACTNVQTTTATGNGNITSTGGVTVTRRGFCYKVGTTGDPTTADSTVYDDGSFGTGAYTKGLTSLSSGTSYRVRAYAVNSEGTGYGTTVQILTKPVAPTGVSATDGSHTNKVVVTWTKSTGATGYKVYEGANLLDTLGDVATYDDNAAPAPTITPGTASASDGTSDTYVTLSLAGEGTNNGTSRTYKVVAFNATGDSGDSTTDAGYRSVGTLTYQWQVSAADSDENFSNISGGTTDPYDAVPDNAEGRYYLCLLDAAGASQAESTHDRGFKLVAAPVITTNAATDVAYTTARLNSLLTDDGGEACEVRFQYYEDGNPAWSENTTWVDGYTTGQQPYVSLDSLTHNTLHHFRAQVRNSHSTVSGTSLDFTTANAVLTPTNFRAFSEATSVALSWTKGAGSTNTHIRYKEGTYPTTTTDGLQVYFGTSSSYAHTGLSSGRTYYYSTWGYSGGTYSDDPAEVMATTLAASGVEGAPDAPAMPPTWFQTPDYTVFEAFPFYGVANAFFDSYEMPRASGWFFTTIFGCLVFGIFTFAVSKHPVPTMVVLAVTLGVASLMKLLPMFMMAFTVIFMIGAFQFGRGK